MRIQSVGAAATGTSHLERNQPCQDAFAISSSLSGTVACVCDGAGSASRAEEGAQALARGVSQALSYDPHLLLRSGDASEQIVKAIQSVREQLSMRGPLTEFHATLCGVVVTAHGSLVFHLGDGLILGIDPDNWDDYLVSAPENGEFAETTYFFTLPGWQQHLRVMCAPTRYRTWFLMSDGTASFAARNGSWQPEKSFLQPVHDYLRSTHRHTAEEALLGTLNDPRSHRITTDDKTLVWLHRAP